jgi:hypothetical protein
VDLDRFYEIIDAARPDRLREGLSADPDELAGVLEELATDEVGEFLRVYDSELVRLNRWSIWGAGYVAAGGMSDDAFHYFRSWLIGKGRDAVEVALASPDDLADFLDDSELENESLEYAGLEVLETRGVDDPRDPVSRTDADPWGDPFDEDTVMSSYPKLAAASGQAPISS